MHYASIVDFKLHSMAHGTRKDGSRVLVSRELIMPTTIVKQRASKTATVDAKARPAGLLDRIESLLDKMRPSEQTVGRFVLRHPNLVISLSFPEIAARTGVSQPTVARFASQLALAAIAISSCVWRKAWRTAFRLSITMSACRIRWPMSGQKSSIAVLRHW